MSPQDPFSEFGGRSLTEGLATPGNIDLTRYTGNSSSDPFAEFGGRAVPNPDEPSSQAAEQQPGLLSRAANAAGRFISEEGPVMAGAGIGGFLGSALGPLGTVGGAALGGAAGEAVKQGFRKTFGGGPVAQSRQEFAGNLNQAMLSGALQEVGGAVVGEAPGIAAQALVKGPMGAERQMYRVLAPTTRETKFVADKVAPELVDRGITAFSRGQLADKIARAKTLAGNAIESAWSNIPANATMKTQPILDAIDKAKNEFVVNNVSVLPQAEAKLDELKSIIQHIGPDVAPETLRKTRQVWDMIVDQAGGFGGKDLKASSEVFAQKQAANAIREEIGKAFPDIKRLNAEFHFWSNVDDVLNAAIQRDANKSLTLTDLVSGSTGATAAMAGHPWALTAPLIVRLMQSTAWRTHSAVIKKGLAEVATRLDQGATGQAAQAMARVFTAATVAIERQTPIVPTVSLRTMTRKDQGDSERFTY